MMLNDFTVPNKELRVTVGMRFEDETLGAQTSATNTAEKGIKPKVITVALLLPHDEADLLSELTAIAQATNADGTLVVYDIVEPAANAMNVRQVKFTDSFDVRDDYRLRAWQINFALKEYKSVPEKMEQRQTKVVGAPQVAAGEVVSGEAVNETSPPETMGSFEKILANLDSALAPKAGSDEAA
ncbi:hypothetical protein [Cellvibrio sp. UBA7671]|uniref:baseplate complex protein n=1 Tax=Cellvibrio sp. UBA7671 TaxID=1946312 RepID=UPI002F360349